MPGETPLPPFQRRINDIGRFDPFEPRFDLLTADARRIEEILNVVIETFGLVTDDAGKRAQPLVACDRRRLAQNGRGAENRG